MCRLRINAVDENSLFPVRKIRVKSYVGLNFGAQWVPWGFLADPANIKLTFPGVRGGGGVFFWSSHTVDLRIGA